MYHPLYLGLHRGTLTSPRWLRFNTVTDPRRLTVARRHVLISIQPINSSLFTDKASFLPQTYRREN